MTVHDRLLLLGCACTSCPSEYEGQGWPQVSAATAIVGCLTAMTMVVQHRNDCAVLAATQVACGEEVLKRMRVVDELQEALDDTIGELLLAVLY